MDSLYQLLDPAKRAAALAQQQQDVSPETDAALQQIGVKKDADPGIVAPGPVTDTGTPVAAPAPLSPEAEVEQRIQDRLRAGKEGTPGALLNTAPDWFHAEAPPKRSVGADVLQTLTGAGAAGAQRQADLSAKEPLRPFAMKAADQGKANTASALGGLVGLLANRKSDAYNANQEAALKQAQMYRVLNGTGGANGDQEYLNYRLRRAEYEERQRLAREKAESEKRRNTLGTPESDAAQQSLVDMGMDPETAKHYTAAQAEKYRTSLMQRVHEDFRGQEADRQFNMNRAARMNDKEAEQLLQVDKEQRAERSKKDEAFIPGTYYVNGHPPPSDVVKEARGFVGDRKLMMDGSARLKEIQSQLGTLEGSLGGYKYTAWLASPEAKKILAEAKLLNTKMNASARNLDHMGVPQDFEIQMQKGVNPDAGTLEGFFTGPVAWDAVSNYYDKKGAEQARLRYNLGFEGDGGQQGSTAQDVPAEQQVRSLPKPVVHAYKRGGQGEEIPVPSPAAGSVPAAGGSADAVPAGATGATPVGIFTVKIPGKGNTSPKPMTQAQYEKAVQAFGPDAVQRMQ